MPSPPPTTGTAPNRVPRRSPSSTPPAVRLMKYGSSLQQPAILTGYEQLPVDLAGTPNYGPNVPLRRAIARAHSSRTREKRHDHTSHHSSRMGHGGGHPAHPAPSAVHRPSTSARRTPQGHTMSRSHPLRSAPPYGKDVVLVPGGVAEDFDNCGPSDRARQGHSMTTMGYRITTQAELFSRGRGDQSMDQSFQHVSRDWLEATTGPQGHTASNRP